MQTNNEIIHQVLERGDCPLHYWTIGSAANPLLIFLHGATLDHHAFDAQVAALAQDFFVLLLDIRGHGLSQPLRTPFTIQAVLDDLLALLDHLDKAQAIFLGQSMGGSIVQEMAFYYPERVRAIVAIGSPCITIRPSLYSACDVQIFLFSMRLYSWIVQYFDLLPWMLRMFMAYRASLKQETRLYHLRTMTQVKRKHFFAIWKAWGNCIHPKRGYRILQPVLLVCGEHDTIGNWKRQMPHWAKRDPSARFVIIPDAGHLANQDNAAEFNRVLLEFLGTLVDITYTRPSREAQAELQQGKSERAELSIGTMDISERIFGVLDEAETGEKHFQTVEESEVEEQIVAVLNKIDSDNKYFGKKSQLIRLYRLWEENNWSVSQLNFEQDRIDWTTVLTQERQQALRWYFAMFLDGEKNVTTTLAPFIDAVEHPEEKTFLATQIADEARHHVFFDRFLRETCDIGHDMPSTLQSMKPYLSWGYLQIFTELERISANLRQNPHDSVLLTQGIVLYHLVLEGTLAHTELHFLSNFARHHKILPGFSEGLKQVMRDESRHIAFGLKILRELVMRSPAHKSAAIALLSRVFPWVAGVTVPPNGDWGYINALGYSPEDIYTFGLSAIRKKLLSIGIKPCEVLSLVQLGDTAPIGEQARRLVILINGGVLGTDKEPFVTEEVLDAIFEAMCHAAAWTQRKHHIRATIQWIFSDALPRSFRLHGRERPEMSREQSNRPDVTLRCS